MIKARKDRMNKWKIWKKSNKSKMLMMINRLKFNMKNFED